MLKKVVSFFLYILVAVFLPIDAACPYEAAALPLNSTLASHEGMPAGSIMLAGFFGPTVTKPVETSPEVPQEPGAAHPATNAIPTPAPAVAPAPEPVPAAQPEVVQPSTPATAPAANEAVPAPPQTGSAPPAPVEPQTPAVQAAPPFIPPPPTAAASSAASRLAKKGDVSFNFDDADVYSVIQTIFGDVLRVNYIIDPRVKGRVNFRSVSPVAKEDVLPLMEVILRLNGVGIVEEGGLYRIVPISDLPKEPAPVGMGRDPAEVKLTGKARLQVVPIKYIQSSEMARILTPFMSTSAVIVDVPMSNHIVIIDTDVNVKRLLQLVDTFDNEQLAEVTPRVFVYSVQNSKAKDLAALLQQIFQGAKAPSPVAAKSATTARTTTAGSAPRPPIPGQPTPPAVSSVGSQPGEGALVSEITKIIPDEVTNSIIILATPEDYALIYDTIQKVDIMPRQVMIEGLIVDITLNDNLSYGLQWSLNTDVKFSGIWPFTNGVNLNGNAFNNPPNLDGTPASKGFTFIGRDPSGNVRAVLTALEDRSKAKVVAAPHILVSDNREARIQIGQQIPIATSTNSQIASSTTVTPVLTSTIQYKDIGIILKVKPQVNDSGLISLELSQEISAISAQTVEVGGLNEVAIDKTEATSNLVARDGDTIIIGGLIREDTTNGSTGLPFLSRIPILGALFGNKSNTVNRKETIILLTPHVIRNEQEAGAVTSDFVNRYKNATKDKEIDKLIREKTRSESAPPKDQHVEPLPGTDK
jgi:type II secretory pathway component GspD/PulD (secretin)